VVGMSIRATTAFCRGYPGGPMRDRVHIVNDVQRGPGRQEPGTHAWCGQKVHEGRFREPFFLRPLPVRLPARLAWCARCVGLYAGYLGLLDEIAADVVSYDPQLASTGDKKWWEFVDAQREVRRKALGRQ